MEVKNIAKKSMTIKTVKTVSDVRTDPFCIMHTKLLLAKQKMLKEENIKRIGHKNIS